MPKRKVVQKSITNFCSGGKEEDGKSEDARENVNNGDGGRGPAKKARRTKSARENEKEENVKTVGAPVNKVNTDYGSIDFDCKKTTSEGRTWNFKISSWNIVSLNSLTKKNGMEFVERESPDIMCFQETKCSEKKVPEGAKVSGYHRYFVSGEKEGYAGVALYTKVKPVKVEFGIGNKEHDAEGRVITAEYEKFYLITAYVPNAGRGLVTLPKRLKWDPLFREHLKRLNEVKPVILCGDLNVAHNEIDLKNPATNTRSAGFTKEERDGFTTLLNDGYIDTFRHLYPDKTGAYTYWNYIGNARSRNTGWRLDYFVVSQRLVSAVCDSVIRNEVYGSDHCPITLFLSL